MVDDLNGLSVQHLRALVTVSRVASVSAAAELLFVSPSQVSRWVATAEKAIGAKMFSRRGPKLALSAVGEGLLPRLEALLQDLEEARRTAIQLSRGESGSVRVGFTRYTAYTGLPWLLKQAYQAAPWLHVHLATAADLELEELLITGRVDLALLNLPLRHTKLESCEIGFDSFAVAVASERDVAGGISLSDETAPRLLIAPIRYWPGTYPVFLARCKALGVSPELVETVNDAIGRMALALDGTSVALVSSIRAGLEFPGVQVVPLRGFEDLGYRTVLAIAPDAGTLAHQVMEIVRNAAALSHESASLASANRTDLPT
jgi:DNA-binding transcriptional LysR family regulator